MGVDDAPLLSDYELDINGAGEALLMLPEPLAGDAPEQFDIEPNQILLIRGGVCIARVAPTPDDLHEDLMALPVLLLAELSAKQADAAPRVTEIQRFR